MSPQSPGPSRVRLSGYGVELAIKSTEYKAQDDARPEEGEDSEQHHGHEEAHTEGFVFATLKCVAGGGDVFNNL